jgi:hypothetical protein
LVVMLIDVLLEPAGIVTLAGVGTFAVLVFVRVTTAPPAGAAPLSDTVSVVLPPPFRLVGLNASPRSTADFTVSVAEARPLLNFAIMAEFVSAATPRVVTVNVAFVFPALTLTVAGTVAAVKLLLSRFTLIPPLGAGPLIVNVAVEEAPPVTLVGLSVTLAGMGAFTVRLPDAEAPLAVPVMVATALADTGLVVTVKVTCVFPASTVTLLGVAAALLLLLRFTLNPPAGAGFEMVTVPVDEVPPVTLEGDRVKLVGPSPLSVSVPEAEALFADAVIVAVVSAPTEFVVTVNVFVVCPAATVTVPGTWAAPLLLLRVITNPAAGAGSLIVTVPVELSPLVTVDGEKLTNVGTGARTVRTADEDAPFAVPVIVADCVVCVWLVVTVKFAVVFPASTVTLAGV